MKKVAFLFTFLVIFFIGCGGSGDVGEIETQSLKGGELIADFPANLLRKSLLENNQIDENATVFGFRAYKIPYVTTDANGNRVNASGIMIVPSTTGADEKSKDALLKMKSVGLVAVLDCHGTIFANKEAPSVAISTTQEPKGAGVIFTSLGGFITLQPDYIGFGDSKDHYQEYLIKKSSASSVVDFLKAAIKFAKDNNIEWLNNQYYLTGYSQGGFVALAALKELELNSNFPLLTVPMAGPYLLDPIAQNVLSLDTIKYPSFMAAVAYSYSKVYDQNISELIQEPYASKLSVLFDGSLTREEIDQELTTKVKGEGGLFTNEIVEDYGDSWFRSRLIENSVVDFSPQTPIKMVHCLGDDVIPYQISEATKDIFKNNLNALYIDLTPVEVALTGDLNTTLRYSHSECAIYAYMIAFKIFTTNRKERIGY
ncbi:MAG: hypothetical protein GXO02_01135 [Epsilonproteobacteria bacterium]|nr:hypothetical protein [Campylobacterota bacterium]